MYKVLVLRIYVDNGRVEPTVSFRGIQTTVTFYMKRVRLPTQEPE